MGIDRHLEWDGCWNVRDLGGLPTVDGRRTRPGAVIRSDSLHRLSAAGWGAAVDHGVRTVVDLRDRAQAAADPPHPPRGVEVVGLGLEDGLRPDDEFAGWMRSGWIATPLYFRRFVERWPDRCARALAAVADAEDGAVVVHCQKGSDRTGLIVALLLELVGVDRDRIVADHLLNAERLRTDGTRCGIVDDGPLIEAILDGESTSAAEVLAAMLESLDVPGLMSAGGLASDQVERLGRRLVR